MTNQKAAFLVSWSCLNDQAILLKYSLVVELFGTYHFIFQCSHYDHLRAPFLEKCSDAEETFNIMDEVEKFRFEKFRFVLSNEKVQTLTADFAQEAFLFRKKTKL